MSIIDQRELVLSNLERAINSSVLEIQRLSSEIEDELNTLNLSSPQSSSVVEGVRLIQSVDRKTSELEKVIKVLSFNYSNYVNIISSKIVGG